MGLTRPKLAQVTTTTSAFDDPIIVLNNNPPSGSNTYDIGIVFERGDDQNRAFLWDESADEFVLVNTTEQGLTNGDVTIAAYANLQVATLSGTATSAKYADLAEKYMPDTKYEPGTVLMFGGEQEVTVADQFATRRVAGVVSTDPAYMMNSELDGGVYIALQGRVPCRVSGIVHKGDLLVASSEPGVAVAWTEELRDPPAGSIIGKSLEEKALVGVDTIEVVVGVR